MLKNASAQHDNSRLGNAYLRRLPLKHQHLQSPALRPHAYVTVPGLALSFEGVRLGEQNKL